MLLIQKRAVAMSSILQFRGQETKAPSGRSSYVFIARWNPASLEIPLQTDHTPGCLPAREGNLYEYITCRGQRSTQNAY